MDLHGEIRSDVACYKSSSKAIELAKKYNTRLHILHLSSAKEMDLFTNDIPLKEKRITAEVCVHHLCFYDRDYKTRKARIRWNPAIKSEQDKNKLWEALLDNRLDVIATDHAPHTVSEKDGNYMNSAGGGPLVQHSLVAILEQSRKGLIPIERVVEKMCHAPAELFNVKNRGFIRENYAADLVLISEDEWIATSKNSYYKCGWTPFEGDTFHYKVEKTFVNGILVFDNGTFNEDVKGQRLLFNR